MSNASVDTASQRSRGSIPGTTLTERRKFIRPRWMTSTPLGVPVEPEV